MPSASNLYVIVRQKKGDIMVIGNRLGEPFTSETNAQRSLTRRQKKSRGAQWSIQQIV